MLPRRHNVSDDISYSVVHISGKFRTKFLEEGTGSMESVIHYTSYISKTIILRVSKYYHEMETVLRLHDFRIQDRLLRNRITKIVITSIQCIFQ